MGIRARILLLPLTVVALATFLAGLLAFRRAREALIPAIGGATGPASKS